MGRYYYYPKTMRQVDAAVLDYFSDITIYRTDAATGKTQTIPVDALFGQTTKSWMYRKEYDSGAISYPTMPCIVISFTGHQYSSERAAAVNESRNLYSCLQAKIGDPVIATKIWEDLEPAPYDYTYDMEILCRHPDDQCQIMEQILPYFNPGAMLRVYEIAFLKIERDLPLHITGISYKNEKNLAADAKDTVYDCSFQLKVDGYMYKPMREATLIKHIGYAAREEGATLHQLIDIDELPSDVRDWAKQEGRDDFWYETADMKPEGNIKLDELFGK